MNKKEWTKRNEQAAIESFYDDVIPAIQLKDEALKEVDNMPQIGTSRPTMGKLFAGETKEQQLARLKRWGITERMMRDAAYERDAEDRQDRAAAIRRGVVAAPPKRTRQDICDLLFGDGI